MHIAVLGGGPGGYQAAFEAARLGAEVSLIERRPDELGGTCLNWGCIPTKTILRTAHIVQDTRHAARFGLEADVARLDVSALRARKDGVVSELRSQIAASATRLKVDLVWGTGRISGPRTIEVDLDGGGTRTVAADAVILASGSKVFELPNIDHSLPEVWTSDDAVSLTEVPERILLIGGGVIGLEFACAYASFGSRVTVVELMPTVLPGNDKRVTKTVQAALEGLGIEFRLGQKVDTVEQAGAVVRSTLDTGEVFESDIVFSAVGRMPDSEGLGCAECGIEMDRAAVLTDEHLRTNVAGMYAVGDLIGGMMLAHVAEEEGVVAARNAVAELSAAEGEAPHLESVDYDAIPACVYTFPEVAVVGSGRDSAKERGIDAAQSVAKFTANGMALAEGDADGFVQLVSEKATGRIVGCQIVGPHAVEIVHEVAVAIRNGVGVRGLAETVHAHPTVSEVIRAAATDACAKCGV